MVLRNQTGLLAMTLLGFVFIDSAKKLSAIEPKIQPIKFLRGKVKLAEHFLDRPSSSSEFEKQLKAKNLEYKLCRDQEDILISINVQVDNISHTAHDIVGGNFYNNILPSRGVPIFELTSITCQLKARLKFINVRLLEKNFTTSYSKLAVKLIKASIDFCAETTTLDNISQKAEVLRDATHAYIKFAGCRKLVPEKDGRQRLYR